MPAPPSRAPSASRRRVRARLVWRLLLLLVCLVAGFILLGLMGLGGYLLMMGLDVFRPERERYMALGGGALILLVSLWLLIVAMPRRLGPTRAAADDRR